MYEYFLNYLKFLIFLHIFIHLGLGLKITPDPKIFNMKNDPKGEKIQYAISSALLKVSNELRNNTPKK